MALFLSSEELTELTGYKTAKKQNAWLELHGYLVETNAAGKPRITYSQIFEKRQWVNAQFPLKNQHPLMQSIQLNTLNNAPSIEPNFIELRKKIFAVGKLNG